MGRKLADAVVVITGASSGIGEATAYAFARLHARLVLAARDAAALEEVARRCVERGAPDTLVVPTDVTDAGAVRELAARAVALRGRIDVWVNNAGVYIMGPVDEIPEEAYRRVIETNLVGTIHGCQAALRQFRKQRAGHLINISSVAGFGAYRFAAVYNASKFGVRGLTEAMRQEVIDDDEIHVSHVAPPSVDTPLFQHAANYTGRRLVAMKPVYPAERIAAAVVRCARRPRRVVAVGSFSWTARLFRALMPGLYERAQARAIPKGHLGPEAALPTDGNLFASQAPHGVSGGWRSGKKKLLLGAAIGVPLAFGLSAAARARS